MLGQHVHKYKRRHKYNKLSASTSTRNGMFGSKGGIGSKDHKFGNGRQGVQNIEMAPQYVGHYKEADFSSGDIGSKDHKFGNGRQGVQNIEMVPQYVGHYKEAYFSSDYGLDRSVYEPAYLDIGDGVSYKTAESL
ncbi:hypothetical protein HanPI659440_Chr09g0338241 [Helianthus annuus]|nr:hypothetical protein HanPI659440_Chr09g0338241 [Helianthus annuus]